MRRPFLCLLLALLPPPAAAQEAPFPEPHLGDTAESTGTGEEFDFVVALMRGLQPKSFARNREYCGYIGRDRSGRLVGTRHMVGEEASCLLPTWPTGMTVIASYHTHSTYSPAFDSEFPTAQDMESDRYHDIDGYIATPGGRLWHVDSDTMTIRQLCGMGCLPQDPAFQPDPPGTVGQGYTYDALRKRED